MSKVLMSPPHPRWTEFVTELAQATRCARTTEHARRVLESMPGIDISGSLEALRQLGGECDCTILFDLREACPSS
jgi:hypothetical protein